jgi:diguanylate cyclase (GGDEF)-like protein
MDTAATNLARSLSRHAEDTFTEADTVLVSLVERLEVDGVGPRHLQRLKSLLKQHITELPQLHGLFVYDEHGHWLVNARQAVPARVNNSDREYFIHHRSHADHKPFIGPPVHSRSTGEWIMTISRRFNHADGSFAGVVLATIDMNYFSRFYDTIDVGSMGTIILTLDKGILLVRRPFLDKWIGQTLKDASLFREHLPKSPHGSYMGNKSVIDGVERVTNYRRTDRYPMVLAVSLSKEEILSAWWTNTWQSFLAVTTLAALLALMGFRLIHHINRHLETERKLFQAQAELQNLNQYLEKIALQDSLTGLANRRQFDLTLINEFNRGKRNKSTLALLMIDVDSFKQFNDIYGHPAGDECLKKISAVIQSCQKRTSDLSARYGGEEIAVLMPDTDLRGAFALAERTRIAIRNLEIEHKGSSAGFITISCGIASLALDASDRDPMELVAAADQALYTAKTNGRNLVCCAADALTV